MVKQMGSKEEYELLCEQYAKNRISFEEFSRLGKQIGLTKSQNR